MNRKGHALPAFFCFFLLVFALRIEAQTGSAPAGALLQPAANAAPPRANAAPAPAAPTLYAPDRLSPGDPLLAWLVLSAPIVQGSASLYLTSGDGAAGQKLVGRSDFFKAPAHASSDGYSSNGYLYAMLIAVPQDISVSATGLLMRIEGRLIDGDDSDGSCHILSIERNIILVPRSFITEDIPLDAANTAIRTQPDPIKEAQTKIFAALFSKQDPDALFLEGPMNKPVQVWRLTSTFGDRRRYIYSKNGIAGAGGTAISTHNGIDLGAPAGQPVMACAPGRVVFASMRIVTGNTVVIEHLPGLFSIYMHMSKITVATGDIVKAAQPLGAVGSTGLSTGPHLHWELRIGPVAVNPEYWLTQDPFFGAKSIVRSIYK